MTICIDPKEVRSSQVSWGTPTGESKPWRVGGLDSVASGSENPGGVGGNHLCTMAITPKLTAPTGSEASLGWLWVCRVVTHSSWSPVFFPQLPSLLSKVWGSHQFLFSNLQHGGINRTSLSIRGIRHLQRSWTALQSIPRGAPNSRVHGCRVQVSATVWSFLTI